MQREIGESLLLLFQTPQIFADETIATILINDIDRLDTDPVLVLDDYHTIQNQAIPSSLSFILDHLPDNLHVFISTRVDPPGCWHDGARETSRFLKAGIKRHRECTKFQLDYNRTMLRPNSTISVTGVLRRLGTFERALLLSDQHSPFNVVSVLQLEQVPAPEIIQHALGILQKRHPLLQACVRDRKFWRLSDPSFSFQIAEQQGEIDWLKIVAHEMNTRLNPESGLFNCLHPGWTQARPHRA